MIDPALTFTSTDEAIEARRKLLARGVGARFDRNEKITYWAGEKQLGKVWNGKTHRMFRHVLVSNICETADRKIAVVFHFVHKLPEPLPRRYDTLSIYQLE